MKKSARRSSPLPHLRSPRPRRRATSKDTTITGAGSSFVSPLVSIWTPALGSAFGYTRPVQPGRLRRRHRGDHQPPGRLRRLGRAADARPVDRLQGLRPDPVGARRRRRSPTTSPARPVHLNLDGKTIAKIFLGQITNWNDPAIKALNKGANLPDLKITPIFRSDGSGTTYNFTDYLSAVEPELEVEGRQLDQRSRSRRASAPRGSAGVAGVVSRTAGGITYVDVAFALEEPHQVRGGPNAAGKFLFPSIRRIQAAAATRSRRCRRTTRCTSSTRRSRLRSRTRSRPTPT